MKHISIYIWYFEFAIYLEPILCKSSMWIHEINSNANEFSKKNDSRNSSNCKNGDKMVYFYA